MNTDTFSLYECKNCSHWTIVNDRNYHPWCLHCMSDHLFDWNSPYLNMIEEKAKELQKELNA